MPAVTKVSLNIPSDLLNEAREFASQNGTNFTSFVRDSLMTELALQKELREGNDILIEGKGRKSGKRKTMIVK